MRVSARKARQVLDQIRDRPVADALATLQFTPRIAARLVEKVLRAAVANAEHNHQVRELDTLRVVQATADDGPSLKRVQPRAMGRAFFIRHRTSHLTIGVSDEGNGAGAPAVRAERGAATRPPRATAPPQATPAAKGQAAPAKRRKGTARGARGAGSGTTRRTKATKKG